MSIEYKYISSSSPFAMAFLVYVELYAMCLHEYMGLKWNKDGEEDAENGFCSRSSALYSAICMP